MSPLNEQQVQQLVVALKKRLANARRRASYWSGRPSFTFGHSMSRVASERLNARGSNHEMEYESAMDDVGSLAEQIAVLTGKRPAVQEYKLSK
ncbi:hypothetical protein [Janthinobacterium sp. CAN_S7]|uniref:hypothetical protein n=1 Tax=Janthinobacterium sp. CAN_S7 TaxID=3071704 RepID=UPI00319E87D5